MTKITKEDIANKVADLLEELGIPRSRVSGSKFLMHQETAESLELDDYDIEELFLDIGDKLGVNVPHSIAPNITFENLINYIFAKS